MTILEKTEKTINVLVSPGEDAHKAAAEVARSLGTKLHGNMRWRGACGPECRDIGTKDGRTIVLTIEHNEVPRKCYGQDNREERPQR